MNLKRIYFLLILFVNFSKIIVLIVLMCYTKCTKKEKILLRMGSVIWKHFHTKRLTLREKMLRVLLKQKSKDEAARKIKEQGFTPISIGKQELWIKMLICHFGPKIPARDMSVFCRQFAKYS